jgi:uncharacterized protein
MIFPQMDKNRLLFIINTPGQAHTWHFIIKNLIERGCQVKILARDYGSTPDLLHAFGFQFTVFHPVGSQVWRLAAVARHFEKCYTLSRGFAPTAVLGFGLDAAVVAAMFRKPCIAFFDNEHTYWQNRMTAILARWVITPDTFQKTLGKNHIRVASCKEMAYLHPSSFKPDVTVYDELKINRGEPYIIMRFNLIDAIHDIGMHALPISSQIELVKQFEKYARVFISPEGALVSELEPYRLKIPYHRIHHALYFASLLVSDSCTMTTEAAVLGTPAVRIHPIVGRNTDPAIFRELEEKYNLVYSFHDFTGALQKALQLISRPGLKAEWDYKRRKLMLEKIDFNDFMLDFIHYGPEEALANQNNANACCVGEPTNKM